MKKLLLFLPLSLLFCIVKAASVDVQTAQTVALNFFKVTTGSNTGITAVLKYTRTEDDNSTDFYVFDLSPAKGFVIVAGNNNTIPVLGYSTETNFKLDISHAVGLSYWMDHVAARIHKSIQLNVQADTRINYLWNAYLNGQNPFPSRSAGVAPLLTTTWDQGLHYNDLCPYNTADNQRTVTGCVATAMAQIMKYWGYPARGKGSYTYVDSTPAFSNNYGRLSANFDTVFNWAQMPAACNAANAAVALLMYDCGVSVGMDYGDDNEGGSGAWVLQAEAGAGQPCSEYSYVNYFYYNPNTIQGIIKSHYAQTDFINLIKNELDNSRVVQYEGDDTSGGGGHTWVCDGYDASDKLHMNWGWGGQSNGYFAINNLNGGMYDFDDAEAALIGIEPISPVNVIATAASQAVCPGGSTTLTAVGPASATYSWIPTTGLSCPTCAVTTVSPSSNAIYSVTADSAGVKGYGTIALSIEQPVTAGFKANTTASCAAPAIIPFSNLSVNGESYLWDFGDGTTDTAVNPVHTYTSYGSYNVRLSSYNICGGDSVLRNQAVQITDQAPTAPGQSIYAGNSATLTATGAGSVQWYDAPTGGNLVYTGSTYVTPALSNSTNYYINSFIAPSANIAGPADNSLGNGGYFNGSNEHGTFFNCTTDQTLDSVDVYAQTAGNRTIILEDSSETIISSVTVNIPVGKSTIGLNLFIHAENKLKLALKGNTYLYRNNAGAVYPYNSADGTITLTNSDAGTPGYFYYFYNWKLQQPGCTTATTTVPVTVNPEGINTLSNVEVLSLFPDPAQNQLTVNISSGTARANWKLTAYNTLGQTMLEREVMLQTGSNTFMLDISMLAPGVHVLSLQNGKTVINRRFVKVN